MMKMKWMRLLGVSALALLLSAAAQAYSVTITYQNQPVISVEEGETLTVPLFDTLDAEVQAVITQLGYLDEYLAVEGTCLTVPTGCLDQDISIDINEANVPGAVLAVSFQVNGSPDQFDFSCLPELTLPYGNVVGEIDDEGTLTLAYWEDGSLTSAGISNVTVDMANDTVTANVAHMSVIAVTQAAAAVPVMGLGGLAAIGGAVVVIAAAALRRRRS